MFLAYIDDSESAPEPKKDQQKSAKPTQCDPFQVLCAVLVGDTQFLLLEVHFSICALSGKTPQEFPEDFEFHAKDLFHGSGFFEQWQQSLRFFVFKQCMEAIAEMKLPIIYGAVDKVKLSQQLYKSANPLDVSFRLCVERIQKWLESDKWRTGLLIADTFDPGKKRNLQRVFREYRKKFIFEAKQAIDKMRDATPEAPQQPQALATSRLLDDMYFGDSSDSVGIQAADMCAFLIRRHLEGREDSEWLYKIIEPLVQGQVWPE